MRKLPVLTLMIAIVLATASFVRADIITNWQFSVNSTFTTWLGATGYNTTKVAWQDVDSHTNKGITVSDGATKIGWSSSDGRTSSLELNANSGTITTDGAEQSALTMIHNNSVIGTGSPAPKVMETMIDVLLTGTHEDGKTIEQSITMTLLLGFIETPNANSGMLSGHTQDDIFFIIENPLTTQRFSDAYGNIYDVSMDAVFSELSGVALDTAQYYIDQRIGAYYDLGDTSTLYGWSTLEKTYAANTMDVNIVVRHDTMPTTPEPGTMLIFVLAGVAAVPLYRRNRRHLTVHTEAR